MNFDEAFLKQFANGDSKAFDAVYEQFRNYVVKVVTGDCGSEEEALDVLQDTVIAVYDVLCVKKKVFPFVPLFKRIAKNKSVDLCREKNRKKVVRIDDNDRLVEKGNMEDDFIQAEQDLIRQKKLDKSFQMLDKSDQELLRMVAKGLSPKQIAEQFQISTNTFYKRKHDCIKRWRAFYEKLK